MTTVFAIIVTYNAMRRQWIEHCLESLCQSTQAVTPIVVDNGSTDGTCDYMQTHHPEAVFLPQGRNLGFGQANNVGIRYALSHHADHILLLNQDATLHPEALAQMLAVSDRQSILSPLQLNGDGSQLDKLFKYVLLQADHQLIDDVLIGLPLKSSYANGRYAAACWLMPASLIEVVGGFNPLFFHYSEDYNYLHRIAYHGMKTLLVPGAIMYHDRKQHGSNQVYNHKQLRRDMLLAACDVNKSPLQCILQWGRILVYRYSRDLPAHNYIPGSFCVELFWILAHLRKIAKSRKAEKVKGRTWL